MSYLMDYGPDWPPRPPRRAERRRTGIGRQLWLNAGLLVGAFLIVAALAVISDHREQHIDFPMTNSTTSPTRDAR
jgi:hypothetical protein